MMIVLVGLPILALAMIWPWCSLMDRRSRLARAAIIAGSSDRTQIDRANDAALRWHTLAGVGLVLLFAWMALVAIAIFAHLVGLT